MNSHRHCLELEKRYLRVLLLHSIVLRVFVHSVGRVLDPHGVPAGAERSVVEPLCLYCFLERHLVSLHSVAVASKTRPQEYFINRRVDISFFL